jgi:hypothetical protein
MRYLVYLSLLIFLASCEKGAGEFILKGTVTDASYQTNLIGATVKLYKVPIATTQEVLVGTVTIGSNGTYEFTFPREKMERYTIHITKENYFKIEEDIFYSSLTLSADNIRNYSTKAESWVAIHLTNLNPQVTDHLQYIKQDGLQGCATCCPNTEQNYFGALDTTIYCINNGNEVYSLYYWVYNTTNQGLLTTVTVPFDTTEIVLNY